MPPPRVFSSSPGDCFGMPSHFRIEIGATEHGFSEAISRLEQTLARSPSTR
jgi:hypothetical protein